NLVGVVAVLLLAWDAAADRSRQRHWRWLAWAMMAAPLPALFWLHGVLGAQMDEGVPFGREELFRPWHRAYLWLSTARGAAAMAYLALALTSWRAEDRGRGQVAG